MPLPPEQRLTCRCGGQEFVVAIWDEPGFGNLTCTQCRRKMLIDFPIKPRFTK